MRTSGSTGSGRSGEPGARPPPPMGGGQGRRRREHAKGPRRTGGLSRRAYSAAGAAEALEALVELLDTTGRVHDALLARVERVRRGRDLDIDDGVLDAVE